MQWLTSKATVIVLHELGNYYDQPTSSPHWTLDSIFHSFTQVDVWRVSRATEPKQSETFESRPQQPACAFNLDTPSTPTGFLCSFTLLLPCCKKIDLFSPLKWLWESKWLWTLFWSSFCLILHGLFTDWLVTGDYLISLQPVVQ